jgi:hypothetical protein
VSPLPPPPYAWAGEWLASAAARLAAGVVLGTLVAHALRRLRLHWSWAALALAPLLALRPLLGGIALPLLAACVWAAVSGSRRRREELLAGGTVAAEAERVLRPSQALWRGAIALRGRLGAAPRGDRHREAGLLALGSDGRGRTLHVPFAPASGAGRHTLVLGATGSGKTTTLALLLRSAVEAGAAAVVVDPKGDPALRAAVHAAARAAARPLLEWSPEGPATYNPYARGTDTEIADKVLAGERFTEPHYLRQAQRYVGHAVRALRAGQEEVTLARLVELLDAHRLEQFARTLPEQVAARCEAYLDALTPRQRADLAGVRDRLAILAESDAGPWLAPSQRALQIELLAAARSRTIVYFALRADTRPLMSEMLGAAIVQDLLTVVGALQERPLPLVVALDEFSALAAERVVRLFARARSAGVSLLLATQELADLRPEGRERMLEQVMGNLSLLVAHRQAVPASARTVAELGGTREARRLAWLSDGRRSATAVREPAIDAEQVMSLRPGRALVVAMESGVRCGFVQIAPGRKAGDGPPRS